MKINIKLLLGVISLATVAFSAIVVQAGGWDNFKLRHFHLTQYLQDQERELRDLQKQNIDFQKNARVDLDEIINGGPPKDGIPSIDNPKFNTADTTPFPSDHTVIGVIINGEAKAYPFGIMNWHEMVNDTVGGVNISVSYCPLCDTIVAFKRGDTTFGVSGKLYQSCLVMYDRATDSLYAQPWGMGIVGENVNRSVEKIPALKTTLGAWLAAHPNSKILSTETGHKRNYQDYPYGTYYTNERIIFPVRNQDQRTLNPKEIVSYVWEADGETPRVRFSGASQQFVHSEIKKIGQRTLEFNGRQIRVRWDSALETVMVEEIDGTPIPSSTAFVFVYLAFFGQ